MSEVEIICTAYKLLHTSGYTSLEEAVHLVYDGNMQNMPSIIIHADIERAYCIYVTPIEYLHGELTKIPMSRLCIDDTLKEEIYTDVMHIDGVHYLVSVAVPLY